MSLKLTNVRVNPTPLVVAAGAAPNPVYEALSMASIPYVQTSTSAVAFAYMGLAQQTVTGVTNYSACSAISAAAGAAFTLHFGEGTQQTFKTQGGSGNNTSGSGIANNTETAYFVTSGGVNNQANSGTRVKVVFTHVPANMNLYVPTTLATDQAGAGTIVLTASEAGAFSAVPATRPRLRIRCPLPPHSRWCPGARRSTK